MFLNLNENIFYQSILVGFVYLIIWYLLHLIGDDVPLSTISLTITCVLNIISYSIKIFEGQHIEYIDITE